MGARVAAVHRSSEHTFSKAGVGEIELVAGLGSLQSPRGGRSISTGVRFL